MEVIDIDVNCDHVHLYIQHQPKYSVFFIYKRFKGRMIRVLRQTLPELKELFKRSASGHQATIIEVSDMAGKLLRDTLTGNTKNRGAETHRQDSDLSPGYSDCGIIF